MIDFKNSTITPNFENLNFLYDQVLSRKQGFVDLSKTQIEVANQVLDWQKNQKKWKNVVILGIGGSMLGPKTVLEALNQNTETNIVCLDNIDPFVIDKQTKNLNLSDTIFLVQTKSGATPETLAQYFYFENLVKKANLNPKEHFVFVTDPKVGYLRQIADGFASFEVPENVGGRFSVITPISFVVASLVGIDILELVRGSEITTQIKKDAFQLAQTQLKLSEKGYNINVFMPYSSRLNLLSNWFVQLLAESTGKEKNLKGEIVKTGITPLPSLGATDQHSQSQLFVDGPDDKLVIFVNVLNHNSKITIPANLPKEFEFLQGVSFEKLIQAEFEATRTTYTEKNKPNCTIEMKEINAFEMGKIFILLELATAFLGEMLQINTFDQPGVERSKVLTKQYLAHTSQS